MGHGVQGGCRSPNCGNLPRVSCLLDAKTPAGCPIAPKLAFSDALPPSKGMWDGSWTATGIVLMCGVKNRIELIRACLSHGIGMAESSSLLSAAVVHAVRESKKAGRRQEVADALLSFVSRCAMTLLGILRRC